MIWIEKLTGLRCYKNVSEFKEQWDALHQRVQGSNMVLCLESSVQWFVEEGEYHQGYVQ